MQSRNGTPHADGSRPDGRGGPIRSIAEVLAELFHRHGLVLHEDEPVFAPQPPATHRRDEVELKC